MNSVDGEIMDIFIQAYNYDITPGECFEQIKALIDKEVNKARLQELLNIPFNDGRFSDKWIKEHWAKRIESINGRERIK